MNQKGAPGFWCSEKVTSKALLEQLGDLEFHSLHQHHSLREIDTFGSDTK